MKTSLLAGLTLVFSFLGIADAWYLTQSAYAGTPLTCDITGLDGCNTVAQSAYSHLFGYPLALYGVFFFGFLFVLAALSFFMPRRAVYLGLYGFGIAGLAASIVFVGIQVFLIQAICIYCLGSAALSLLVFACAHVIWKRERSGTITFYPAPGVLP